MPWIRAYRPDFDVPSSLEELVDRVLRKNPERRFAGAGDGVVALPRVVDEAARIAPPRAGAAPIEPERTVLEPRVASPRRPAVAWTAGALVVVLFLALLAALGIALVVRPGGPGRSGVPAPPEPSAASEAPNAARLRR